jgi:hypothetical protein
VTRPAPLLALALVFILTACDSRNGPSPDCTAYSRAQAIEQAEPLDLEVVKVWSVVADALEHGREPGISHRVEAVVKSGPRAGEQLDLPYDEWNVGRAPPSKGARLIAAPADWVKRGKDSNGRPMRGF